MAAQNAQGNSQGWSCYQCLKEQNFSQASGLLRIANMINAGLAIFLGVFSLVNLKNLFTLNIAALAISIYVMLFGCLLCVFECRVGFLERNVRRYFGFMFSYLGRTIFLFFLGIFCIALKDPDSVAFLVIGILTFLNGFLNCFVMYRYGEMFTDPTGKYATAEAATARYVEQNPELARQAIGAGASFAMNNPQLARQGVSAAREYAQQNPENAQKIANQVARV